MASDRSSRYPIQVVGETAARGDATVAVTGWPGPLLRVVGARAGNPSEA